MVRGWELWDLGSQDPNFLQLCRQYVIIIVKNAKSAIHISVPTIWLKFRAQCNSWFIFHFYLTWFCSLSWRLIGGIKRSIEETLKLYLLKWQAMHFDIHHKDKWKRHYFPLDFQTQDFLMSETGGSVGDTLHTVGDKCSPCVGTSILIMPRSSRLCRLIIRPVWPPGLAIPEITAKHELNPSGLLAWQKGI